MPHRKPTDKQLWTNVAQKTNRQTTVDTLHRNEQTNNCGQTPNRKPTIKSTRTPLKEGIKDKQLWTKRHTENQQRNNCGQTPHRKPTIKSTRTPLKEGITDKQLWTKRHTENQQTKNCGQTSHRKPTDKHLWTHVTETNRQTTVDKRQTENQQLSRHEPH